MNPVAGRPYLTYNSVWILLSELGELRFVSTTPRILVLGAQEDAGQLLLESVKTPEYLVSTGDDAKWLADHSAADYSAALVLGDSLHRLPMLMAFESVVKHIPEGIAVLNTDLKIQWCNDQFIELTGRTALGLPSPNGLSFDTHLPRRKSSARILLRSTLRWDQERPLGRNTEPVKRPISMSSPHRFFRRKANSPHMWL